MSPVVPVPPNQATVVSPPGSANSATRPNRGSAVTEQSPPGTPDHGVRWQHRDSDQTRETKIGADADLAMRGVFTKEQTMGAMETDIIPQGSRSHRRAVRGVTLRASRADALRRWAGHEHSKDSVIHLISRKMVENKWFVFFTTVLTIYALIGDDLRLRFTNKPADFTFNIITLVCLVVFAAEITLSCLGKSDYFLGFFFILDVVSTSTMLLDLTWVSEIVLGSGEAEDVGKLRGGRTARVGARAGRVVRVIRLVRILKLYKAIHEARLAQQQKEKEGDGGEDDWGDDKDAAEKEAKEQQLQASRESRVGKKLSEMTTRRVIVLVLTMLLVMPFLSTDSSDHAPIGAFIAADTVLELFMDYNMTRSEDRRLRYERSVLNLMYYHNWFSANYPDTYGSYDIGPVSFQTHVFWAGIMTVQDSQRSFIDDDQAWSGLAVRKTTVENFNLEVSRQQSLYRYGTMPSTGQDILSSQWTAGCAAKNGIYRRGISLLEREIDGEIGYAVKCPEDLRNFERTKYYPRTTSADQYKNWHFAFYFDTRPLQHSDATNSLLTTTFLCVVLCVASLCFSSDANRLVLRPVETMIKRVEIIREDPLVAVQMADEEFRTEEREKAKMRANRSKRFISTLKSTMTCGDQERSEPMETVILEKTIIKLGSLLALGFGEAGANIIGHNLESSDSAGVNGMVEGVRVEAIIGVVRIQDFSTATEVLKGKVMTFVNQIAEIVHGVVSEFHGAANKNNGDTFLVVWRISGLEDVQVSRMADFSTIAFAKILGAVHRSPLLATYRGHPAMQQRLGSDYRVCLTFGLHAGWAIEGAVGSEFKIDASYLSPNVSIAVQVEQATSIYNIPILISASVMDLVCTHLAKKFRKIDRAIIRGSPDPIDLYCLDLDFMSLPIDTDKHGRPAVWNSRLRFKARQFLEMEKTAKLELAIGTPTMFDQSQEIAMMRRRSSTEFLQQFNMGYANFFEGEWQVAKRLLEKTRFMCNIEDGPSEALLRFMEQKNKFVAPPNWTGVHDLFDPDIIHGVNQYFGRAQSSFPTQNDKLAAEGLQSLSSADFT